jgi:ADP-ribose pyrophosphatase YjhB (NUDIX family)
MTLLNTRFIIHVNCLITNKDQQILLVRERKPESFGKLNLPGGHLEIGERLIDGIIRECREEVALDIRPQKLIGIYTGQKPEIHYLGFVFYAETDEPPKAQTDQVLDCELFTAAEILHMPEEKLLNPAKLKSAVQRFLDRQFESLELLEEFL